MKEKKKKLRSKYTKFMGGGGGGGVSTYLYKMGLKDQGLIRFIGTTEGPRWKFCTLVLRKTCRLIMYYVPPFRYGPSLKIRPISSFDHQFIGFWKVMNIIARGCSPCLLVPQGLDSEEQTLWERSTHKLE